MYMVKTRMSTKIPSFITPSFCILRLFPPRATYRHGDNGENAPNTSLRGFHNTPSKSDIIFLHARFSTDRLHHMGFEIWICLFLEELKFCVSVGGAAVVLNWSKEQHQSCHRDMCNSYILTLCSWDLRVIVVSEWSGKSQHALKLQCRQGT